MATIKRDDAKEQILDILREQGYPTYARLADLFDIYLTDDPEVIGYMVPGKAKIVLNKDLSIDQVSTIIRHEILHEYLTHAERKAALLDKESKDLYDNHELANVAADFEISNVGYTERDKTIARAIKLGDKTLQGLVTEDQYPGWEKKSFEDMYRELAKRDPETDEMLQKLIQMLQDFDKQDLDDMQDQVDQMSDQNQQQSSSSSQSTSGEEGEQDAEEHESPASKASSEKDGQEKDEQDKTVKKIKKAIQKEAEKLSDEIDELRDDLEKQQAKQSDNVFPGDKEQKEQADIARRVEQIKREFTNLKNKEAVVEEATEAKRKERAAKEIRHIERVKADPLHKFKLNLNRFIQDQIKPHTELIDYMNNPTYADSDMFVDYRPRVKTENIPVINVYWDVSGSFDDPAKTAGARSAIATLNKYVKQGLIQIKTYYVGDSVSNNLDEVLNTGGANGNAIIRHVKQTKPNNVIVITDSDPDAYGVRDSIKVPGAVWFLFFEAASPRFAQALTGKQETKEYLIKTGL